MTDITETIKELRQEIKDFGDKFDKKCDEVIKLIDEYITQLKNNPPQSNTYKEKDIRICSVDCGCNGLCIAQSRRNIS